MAIDFNKNLDEARAIGIDYPTLCDNLINISLKKYQ